MKNNSTIFQAVNYFASSGVLLISIKKKALLVFLARLFDF